MFTVPPRTTEGWWQKGDISYWFYIQKIFLQFGFKDFVYVYCFIYKSEKLWAGSKGSIFSKSILLLLWLLFLQMWGNSFLLCRLMGGLSAYFVPPTSCSTEPMLVNLMRSATRICAGTPFWPFVTLGLTWSNANCRWHYYMHSEQFIFKVGMEP